MTTHTTGTFTYSSWDEATTGESPDGAKLARATVVNTFSGGITAEGTSCVYAITYLTGKTGVCRGYEMVTGALDGRRGGFVLDQHATFGEDGVVHCTFEVVAGSGTGELAGLSGTGAFTAVPGEPTVPYTFDYRLD
ncbi:DUF3224 domain-containing protein [Streptomyces pactum]|uniref:DUF3224 domain-containing protein n=1 Tax=Streptomyces pactum TaxID=68249 RepID=A0ABS0NEV6_9ACTN|nr:DUF3224 domain-containing protein [Streptomyces pactum]MBH5333727.1 DUF3224 domain-containing protein [Streptomyces pactum]